jgi:hypothetical protein
MPSASDPGWGWFDDPASEAPGSNRPDLCRAFARCFTGGDGERVIEHLTKAILCRRLGPQASDAELRQLEGQRCAVAYIVAMVERGRATPRLSIASEERDPT